MAVSYLFGNIVKQKLNQLTICYATKGAISPNLQFWNRKLTQKAYI